MTNFDNDWILRDLSEEEIDSLMQEENNDIEIDEFIYAYLAGFFDGEGTICVFKRSRTKQNLDVVIRISNTNKNVLELFETVLGGTLVGPRYNGPNRKLVWEWSCYGYSIDNTLEKLLPYLRVKREQAELALRFRKTFKRGRSPKNFDKTPILNEREEIWSKIKTLNKRGLS